MLRGDVDGIRLSFQILCLPQNFKSGFPQIPLGCQIQIRVVRLEMDLPAGARNRLYFSSWRVCVSRFLWCFVRGHGLAEIDVDPIHDVLRRQDVPDQLNIVRRQRDVIRVLPACSNAASIFRRATPRTSSLRSIPR